MKFLSDNCADMKKTIDVLTNRDKPTRTRNVVWKQILMDAEDRPMEIDPADIEEVSNMDEKKTKQTDKQTFLV